MRFTSEKGQNASDGAATRAIGGEAHDKKGEQHRVALKNSIGLNARHLVHYTLQKEKEQLFDQMKTVQGRAMKLECAQLKARYNPKRFKQELNEELVSVPTDASPQDLASHSEQIDLPATSYHGALQQWFQVAYLSELYERLSRKGHSGRKTKAIVANVMNIALHSRAGDSSRKFSLGDQGTGVDSYTSDECQY
ncbi:uncharacterized protein EI90DRAFT_3020713 [Cantharellus anzutake]|uniref:uncharacterized protein n=1 Tax=Cantharellus anzutake TaxID=1750568 RepID=UPI001907E3C1|nr:uncharacterized protein EI90DRAFT_3020713 [Cantharellus anzutake]KAF8319858.1 hypothetical protein EI90DRAFT_3020713 [Cantharellus anzutake]